MKKIYFYTTILASGIILCSFLSIKSNEVGFDNLQILPKDTDKYQMDSVMNHFSVSLGVNCDFCHVQSDNEMKDWDFASDKSPNKGFAREMMKMTNEINQKYFSIDHPQQYGTRLEVTCYSCHNGKKHPSRMLKKPAFLNDKKQ